MTGNVGAMFTSRTVTVKLLVALNAGMPLSVTVVLRRLVLGLWTFGLASNGSRRWGQWWPRMAGCEQGSLDDLRGVGVTRASRLLERK